MNKRYESLCKELAAKAAPCPFCGERDIYVGHLDFNSFGCKCNQCGAVGPAEEYPEETVETLPQLQLRLVQEAFEAWQTRKPKP